jgi:hypothetical protein
VTAKPFRNNKSHTAEKSEQSAKIGYGVLSNCDVVKGGQDEVHLDLVGKAPKGADDADLCNEVLNQKEICENDTRVDGVRGIPSNAWDVKNKC